MIMSGIAKKLTKMLRPIIVLLAIHVILPFKDRTGTVRLFGIININLSPSIIDYPFINAFSIIQARLNWKDRCFLACKVLLIFSLYLHAKSRS